MNEQYAFAIAFDQHAADSDAHVTSTKWSSLLTQIEKVLEFEGLPLFESARWDEFGQGFIFWGSMQECGKVKSCLSTFPVSIYEERNLEVGYYTCSFGVYYVDEIGQVLGLDSRVESLNGFDIRPQETIPLDAYKAERVEPDIHEKFQQVLVQGQQNEVTLESPLATEMPLPVETLINEASKSIVVPDRSVIPASLTFDSSVDMGESIPNTAQVSELRSQAHQLEQKLVQEQMTAQSKISPEVVASLNQLVTDQTQQLKAQEQAIEQYQSQLHDLQLMLDRKVDPEAHSHLQQHSTAQTEQISELEQELQQLKHTHAQVLASESQRISASEYERLGLVSAEQGKTIIALESQLQKLQTQLDETELGLSRKVDEALLQKALVDHSQQVQLVQTLQTRVKSLEHQIEIENDRVERSEFESIVQESSRIKEKIQILEQEKYQLLKDVEQWRQVASTKVEPDQFEKIQQKASEQTHQIAELQRNISQLQRSLNDWEALAENKIERADYEAALAEIERIRELKSRTLLERIKNWFLGQ